MSNNTASRSPLIIASFDPSSSAIGYAKHCANVSHNVEPELLDAGRITPERATDDPLKRIEDMVREAMKWCREEYPRPEVLVIESTTGKVHRSGRARGMNGAGLGVYGMAVGWLIGVCKGTGIDTVCYRENQWTGGEHKERRAEKCEALHYPRYKRDDDPGRDISDAVMLGRFHCFKRLYELIESAGESARHRARR
jgi:hypothetical protein